MTNELFKTSLLCFILAVLLWNGHHSSLALIPFSSGIVFLCLTLFFAPAPRR